MTASHLATTLCDQSQKVTIEIDSSFSEFLDVFTESPIPKLAVRQCKNQEDFKKMKEKYCIPQNIDIDFTKDKYQK